MVPPAALRGLDALPTPSLLVERERLERNVLWGARRAAALGVRLRPHAKTHKCREVAALQIAAGARGLTVSTLGEASHFAAAGFDDLLYAVPIEPGKFAAAAAIARRGARLALLVESPEIASALAAAAERLGVSFAVHLEIDCGDGRSGLLPEDPRLERAAGILQDARRLLFAGLATHAGHAYAARTPHERRRIAAEERDRTLAAAEALRRRGIEVRAVSVGSTPSFAAADHLAGVDEARPGNYVYFDAFQAAMGTCSLEDCAVSVLAAVVARDPARRRLILDAGALALSKDQGARDVDPRAGFGRLLGLDGTDLGWVVAGVSQEHGRAEPRDPGAAAGATGADALRPGDRVRVLVNHSCLAVAHHSALHLLEPDGSVGETWEVFRDR